MLLMPLGSAPGLQAAGPSSALLSLVNDLLNSERKESEMPFTEQLMCASTLLGVLDALIPFRHQYNSFVRELRLRKMEKEAEVSLLGSGGSGGSNLGCLTPGSSEFHA